MNKARRHEQGQMSWTRPDIINKARHHERSQVSWTKPDINKAGHHEQGQTSWTRPYIINKAIHHYKQGQISWTRLGIMNKARHHKQGQMSWTRPVCVAEAWSRVTLFLLFTGKGQTNMAPSWGALIWRNMYFCCRNIHCTTAWMKLAKGNIGRTTVRRLQNEILIERLYLHIFCIVRPVCVFAFGSPLSACFTDSLDCMTGC